MSAVTFQDHAVSTANASSYTFSGRAIGTHADNRRVHVGASGSGPSNTTVSGITCAAVAMTQNVQQNPSQAAIALFTILDTTNDTAAIVVSYSSGVNRCGIGIWSSTGLSSNTEKDAGGTSSNNTDITVNTDNGGFLIGYSFCNSTLNTTTWTNATERFDETVESSGTTHSGADATTSGSPVSVKSNWGTPSNPVMTIVVSFPVGTQTLTPSLFSNSNTFFSETVAPGAVALAPSLYSDGDTFFTPTLHATYVLTPDPYSDDDTFYDPTVDSSADRNLTPDLFVDNDTFYDPTAAPGIVDVAPDLYSDDDTFYDPEVTTFSAVLPDLFANTNTIHDATVNKLVYVLHPSLVSDADTFFTPTIQTTYSMQADLYVDPDTFYDHDIGAVGSIKPSRYVDPDTFYVPHIAVPPRRRHTDVAYY